MSGTVSPSPAQGSPTATAMQTKYAELSFPDLCTNLGYVFAAPKNSYATFLGMWNSGLPEGDAAAAQLVGVPKFALDEITSMMGRKDVIQANGILLNNPRKVFDVFVGARTLLIVMMRRETYLAGKGYGIDAVADAMAKDVKVALKDASEWADVLATISKRADELEFEAATRFPDTQESELQQTMHDVAIVARVGALTEQDVTVLRHGELPQRLNDPRLIQALYRVPAAAHGIGPEHMGLLRNVYAGIASPCSMRAVGLLKDMIESARQTLCSLVVRLAAISLQTPQAVFAQVENGEWIGERANAIGISDKDLREINLRAAQAASK